MGGQIPPFDDKPEERSPYHQFGRTVVFGPVRAPDTRHSAFEPLSQYWPLNRTDKPTSEGELNAAGYPEATSHGQYANPLTANPADVYRD